VVSTNRARSCVSEQRAPDPLSSDPVATFKTSPRKLCPRQAPGATALRRFESLSYLHVAPTVPLWVVDHAKQPAEKLRAFIVEDNAIILENLAASLEEMAGVQVVGSVGDERAALDWLNAGSDRCDVVIVDIFLKSGSGLGVLRGMRSYAPPPDRVVLTNYATSDMRSRCETLGAEAVFDKSTDIEAMVDWFSRRNRPRRHSRI
jgi:CheY-like chemotaxis protein